MTFEKHLRSVSKAASQRLGILRKSWRVFHDRSLLGRCFRGFVLPVLEHCSAFWCSAADTHLKLYWTVQSVVPGFWLGVSFSVTLLIVDPWQSCVCFIRSGVTQCTLLMVLYTWTICASAGYTRCSGRYTYAPPRFLTLQYSRTFIPLSVSVWNDLANPVFDVVGLAGFKSRANVFLLA